MTDTIYKIFQSTPPVKAATFCAFSTFASISAFQSTPPVKAATRSYSSDMRAARFQSTPPVKAATVIYGFTQNGEMISIHAAREGGDHVTFGDLWEQYISIHAAREGGDCKAPASETAKTISIHAAREGGDGPCLRRGCRQRLFQSTPPVKAATINTLRPDQGSPVFQSTPPVKAATGQ